MSTFTKSSLNAILKELGYSTLYRGNEFNRKPVRSYDGKILKGIPLGSSGPMSTTTSYQSKFRNLVSELNSNGLTVVTEYDYLVEFNYGKLVVVVSLQNYSTYLPSEGMDSTYLTHYVQVTVR